MKKRRVKKTTHRAGLSVDHSRLLDELNHWKTKYRMLIDETLIGVAVTTFSGDVKEANDAYLKMTGFSRAELEAGVARWDTVTDPKFVELERQVEQKKKKSVYEKEYIHRDGTRVPVIFAYTMFNEEDAFCFTIDLTEQKKVQQQLQSAISARDDFLSIASHELKTPLTTLQLQLEMLRRFTLVEDKKLGFNEMSRRLNGFQDQLSRLNHLVGSLLDVTRIRGDRLELDPSKFDLRELIVEVIDRVSDQARSKGAEIHFENGREALGEWDKTRMDQVVTNLLLNAIKYGDGSRIDVNLSSKNAGTVLIQVKDRGIGIHKQDQLRVFDRFERAASHNYGGLGLGLYITRRFVERHGGKIWVESQIKKGSTFFVELPKSRQVTSLQRSSPAVAATHKRERSPQT
jgi:PAS domain S-box-containing protein